MFCSLFVFQSGICPVLDFRWYLCKVSCLCHRVGFCIVLCIVSALNSLAIQTRLIFPLQKYEPLPFFLKQCGNYFQVIFTSDKMKWKRTVGESSRAVREQVFLSRYKSEPGIVECSVSKPYVYCQYCRSRLLSVAKNWKCRKMSHRHYTGCVLN